MKKTQMLSAEKGIAMEKWKSKKRIVVLIVVLLFAVLWSLLPLVVFGEFISWNPIDRTFFDLPSETIITLDGNPAWGWSMTLSGEQNREASELLQEMRCFLWRPSIRLIVPMGGWDQRIVLETEYGRESFVIFDTGLEYNGFIIHCDTAPLMELFECYDTETEELYLFDSGNGGHLLRSDLPYAEETQWWNGASVGAENVDTTCQVEFDGTTYSGVYKDSRYRLYTSYRTDFYETPDGVEFGVRADTKELVTLDLWTVGTEWEEGKLEPLNDPAEELKRLAGSIASKLIDPFEYDCLNPEISMVPGVDHALYTYRFIRMIHDLETSDYVTVILTNRGTLVHLLVGELGWAAGLCDYVGMDTAALVKNSGILKKPAVQRQVYALSPTGELVRCVSVTGTSKEGTNTSVSLIMK